MKLATCALALTVLATPAWAQTCTNPRTQADMDNCVGQDFAKADAALNAAYKALRTKITAGGQDSLRAAEAAWLAYRDKQCAFETLGSAGGTVHPMVETECRTELTAAQTARLNAQLACKEGDLSCGDQ